MLVENANPEFVDAIIKRGFVILCPHTQPQINHPFNTPPFTITVHKILSIYNNIVVIDNIIKDIYGYGMFSLLVCDIIYFDGVIVYVKFHEYSYFTDERIRAIIQGDKDDDGFPFSSTDLNYINAIKLAVKECNEKIKESDIQKIESFYSPQNNQNAPFKDLDADNLIENPMTPDKKYFIDNSGKIWEIPVK